MCDTNGEGDGMSTLDIVAYQEGRNARIAGTPKRNNPYGHVDLATSKKKNRNKAAEWRRGWSDVDAENNAGGRTVKGTI